MVQALILQVVCVVLFAGSAALAQVTPDTTREKAIKEKSVGVGVADQAIKQDKQNQIDNTTANQFNNSLDFLNNMSKRQTERANTRAAIQQKEYDKLETAYDKVNSSTRDAIEYRDVLDYNKDPNADQNGYIVLEFQFKRWSEFGDKYRYKLFPYDISRNKYVSGLLGRMVYEPDVKKAVKNFKNLLEEDEDHHKKNPDDSDWPIYSGEIAHYLGEIYFTGIKYPKSEVERDLIKSKEYFEKSISYSNLPDKNIDFTSRKYIIESYIRLIEIYLLGLGVEKNMEKASELAKDVANYAKKVDRASYITSSQEWDQVKSVFEPLMKQEPKTAAPAVPVVINKSYKIPKLKKVDETYELGVYEVTQAEWSSVMKSNPSVSQNPALPVENVTWDEVFDYLKLLSAGTGMKFRLPTAAEWDKACLAGAEKSTLYCGGNNLNEVAWFEGNSGGKLHKGGTKKPNAWGFYDMSGNVLEWTCEYKPNQPTSKYLKGGSYLIEIGNMPYSAGWSANSDQKFPHYGFRVLREL